MATARNVGAAGWIFFIHFAHRVKVHNNMFLVYTKFDALSYGYKLSFFWGPYRFTWFGTLSGYNWTSHTKVVYGCLDLILYMLSKEV